MNPIALQAHRGASHAAPENTLRAFLAAVVERADAIELDVRITSDDVPIVFHDDDLARMTGAEGRVATTAWERFRELRAGGEPIPALAELTAFVTAHRVPLNLELKPTARPQALVAACLPYLRELIAVVPVMVSSFDPRVLMQLHGHATGAGLALIFDDPRALAALALLPTVDLHPRHDLVTAARLAEWRALPVGKVRVWTVDDVAEAQRLLSLGTVSPIAALITNRPGPLRAELMAAYAQAS